MITLQKWVGALVCALSAYTILANLIQPGEDFISSVVSAVVGFVWFGLSIFIDHVVFRIGQVSMMFVVSVLTLLLNDPKIDAVQVMAGMIFLFTTISLAWSYDFFDKRGPILIVSGILALLGLSTAVTGSIITSAALTFGISIACGVIWGILWSKVRRMAKIAREAIDFADRIEGALQERVNHGNHGR